MEVAVPAGIVWVLALVRVTFAVLRSAPPSTDLDIAWMFVLLAPFVIWKEVAAWRKPRE